MTTTSGYRSSDDSNDDSNAAKAIGTMTIPFAHSQDACAGAVTAHLMRRIAFRAGSYAPGIHETIFSELNSSRTGGSVHAVQRWLDGGLPRCHALGYRVMAKWCAEATEPVAEWVAEGDGHRAAVLPTSVRLLYPKSADALAGIGGFDHAVGLAFDRPSSLRETGEVVMLEPWPLAGGIESGPMPSTLNLARRDHKFSTLLLYWIGWS